MSQEINEQSKAAFATIFGYTEKQSQHLASISVEQTDIGTMLTVRHAYRSDEVGDFQPRVDHPSRLHMSLDAQYLVQGTENVWIVEHAVSRLLTASEIAAVLAFAAAHEGVEDAKIVRH